MIKFLRRLFGRDMKGLKALKVQCASDVRKVGMVASSLADLRLRIQKKFSVTANFRLVEEDGTEIEDEDYFKLVQAQTSLYVLKHGEKWKPPEDSKKRDIETALKSLLDSNQMNEVMDGVLNLLKDNNDPESQALLGRIAETTSATENASAEHKKDHPDWFKGLPSKFKTKDHYMRDNSRRRVRGYMYVASELIKRHIKQTNKPLSKRLLEEIMGLFSERLKENDTYSDYFSRSSKLEGLTFCDEDGWFQCGGQYDKQKCEYIDHLINPYGSLQNRIIFSTWNLDHQIEKSREVLPQLLRAIDKLPKSKDLNWVYFYNMLFTRENLKLVHIACHDKTEHSLKCDLKQCYVDSSS